MTLLVLDSIIVAVADNVFPEGMDDLIVTVVVQVSRSVGVISRVAGLNNRCTLVDVVVDSLAISECFMTSLAYFFIVS